MRLLVIKKKENVMKNIVLIVGRYIFIGFVIILWKDFYWVEVIYVGYFFYSWFILLEVCWEWMWVGKKNFCYVYDVYDWYVCDIIYLFIVIY